MCVCVCVCVCMWGQVCVSVCMKEAKCVRVCEYLNIEENSNCQNRDDIVQKQGSLGVVWGLIDQLD